MRPQFLLLVSLLAACETATPPPAVTIESAPTLAAAATAPFIPTRTPEPGFTLLPATPIPPTETPTPCVNDAQFIADVTVPDFTQLLPAAPIDKRWSVKNTGTCDWGPAYRLVFIEGNKMGAADEHALYPAKAGSEAVVQINMTAPDTPGDYTGRWQMHGAKGEAFGPVLFIKITVIAVPTATAQP